MGVFIAAAGARGEEVAGGVVGVAGVDVRAVGWSAAFGAAVAVDGDGPGAFEGQQ